MLIVTMPDAVKDARVRRFCPLGVPAPRVLSAAQVRQFNELGYLFPLDVFDAREVAAMRAYCDDLFAKAVAAGTAATTSTAGTATAPACTTCAPSHVSWIRCRICSARI